MASEIPTGRVRRMLGAARAGVRAGAGVKLGPVAERSVTRAAEELGQLRGLATKVGQLTGYMEGLVPQVQREAFEVAMGSLQAHAASSSPEKIRAVVEAELGRPLADLFREWEELPFASASIGQVHRARMIDGTRVAVKVQHPGVELALEQDLRNAGTLEGILSTFGPSRLNTRRVLETLAARFREELDYELEARHLLQFVALNAHDTAVQVPRAFREVSSRRVLAMARYGGSTLREAQTHPLPFRVDYAQTLFRFTCRSLLVGGAFNADPHPGNYLFSKDGKVTFLDFGCVQSLSDARKEPLSELYQAACLGDENRFVGAVSGWFGSQGGQYAAATLRFMRRLFSPIFESPFNITSGFVRQLVFGADELKALIQIRDGSIVALPAELALLSRLQFGLLSVLAKLDVAVDYREQVKLVLAECV